MNSFDPLAFILSLLITAAVYSGPIIIYRYLILKEPVEQKRAKKISIIYGILGFVIMFLLMQILISPDRTPGGSILLWSYINYCVLKGGKGKKPEESEESEVSQESEEPEVPEAPEPPVRKDEYVVNSSDATDGASVPEEPSEVPTTPRHAVAFCRKCGKQLLPNSAFCSYCGTRVLEA